ncbi:unnamed protein product [Paramecium sonneborni]|uniref:Transmembrane protein n=1 Tax=Paramecium sonneborni TaxID=65129 RepID=A0A8S1KR36_9CILI|nr:unnamed protein product [Paramecium sonneborni]
MFVLFVIFTISSARLLQRGPHHKDQRYDRQSNNTINQLFENLAKNLDQDQKDELKIIQSYIFDEGFQYYQNQDKERKDKIWLAFFGMAEELDKSKPQENQRIEKDIEYFSSLNYTDKDIVLTKISQELEKKLNDTTQQFNSKIVLTTIEKQIENFQNNPDRSIQSTWNTREYINNQNQGEKEFREIEYQIQEFLDQGLSDQDVKNNITQFINEYFNDSQAIQQDLKNLDQIIEQISQQEKKKNSTQQYKKIRQEIRQIIRDQLKEGKNEQEINQKIQDLLNQNGYQQLNETQKEEIQKIIQNEFIRFNRQKDYENSLSSNSTQQETGNQNKKKDIVDTTQNTQQEQNYTLFYIGGFSTILMITIVVFVIRRSRIKKNQSKQIGFKMQESQQEAEQME